MPTAIQSAGFSPTSSPRVRTRFEARFSDEKARSGTVGDSCSWIDYAGSTISQKRNKEGEAEVVINGAFRQIQPTRSAHWKFLLGVKSDQHDEFKELLEQRKSGKEGSEARNATTEIRSRDDRSRYAPAAEAVAQDATPHAD